MLLQSSWFPNAPSQPFRAASAVRCVVGAVITPYLLEKSRVVTHAAGERSYHTFYQMLAGATDEVCQLSAQLSTVLESPHVFTFCLQKELSG